MQYITVSREYDPKITGTNQPFSLEFKKKSFLNKDDEKIFEQYLDDVNKASIEYFEPFNSNLLQGGITLYPVGKRVKKMDFMAVCPYFIGVWIAVSKKALTIIQNYKLPKYTLIPVNIDTYDEKYYLVGFPLVGSEYVDFSKSIFFHTNSCSTVQFSDFDKYRENIVYVTAYNILLSIKYDYDILNTASATEICLSERLANDLLGNGCTGLIFKSLENISVYTL